MKERILTIRLQFSRASVGRLLSAALLGVGITDLASETLTLSTYYPAPLGVYRELVTTGTGPTNTLLARDNGKVGIGTPTVQAQSKLHVMLPSSGNFERLRIESPGTNVGFGLQFSQPNHSWYVGQNIGNFSDGRFQFVDSTNSRYVMTMMPSGRVGISEGSPIAQLDVNGTSCGRSGYGDRVCIGGDSAGGDTEVQVYAPATRNVVAFWNPSLGTTASAIVNNLSARNAVVGGGATCNPMTGSGTCTPAGTYYATYAPGMYVQGRWYANSPRTTSNYRFATDLPGVAGAAYRSYHTVVTHSLNTQWYCCTR